MRKWRWLGGAVLAGMGAWLTGCQALSNHERAREVASERWNVARADVKARLAEEQFNVGLVESAAYELGEARRLDPHNPQLALLEARILLARGATEDARRLLHSPEAAGADPAEVEYLLGAIAEQRLRWESALEHYLVAHELNPRQVGYLTAAVEIYLQLNRPAEAEELLDAAEAECGWHSAYHMARAECAEQRRDWNRAADAWYHVVGDREDRLTLQRYGLALFQAGRFAEAVVPLAECAQDGEQAPDAFLQLALADCYLETDRPDAARKMLQTVLRSEPRHVGALKRLARALVAEGRLEQALRTAEQAVSISPRDVAAHELAAALAYRSGAPRRARQYANHVRQLPAGRDSEVAHRILELTAVSDATGEGTPQ